MLEQYSLIQLVTDRYKDRGVTVGAIGVILEVYGDEAYEVEFSHEDGTTIAWFAVQRSEVKPYDESSPNTVSLPTSKSTLPIT